MFRAAPARLFEEMLKLFLSGHAVASFEGLEQHGLFAELFPESAAALRTNRSGALRRVIVEGLANTDTRVAAGEPVSPAFLFALLLWPAYCRAMARLQKQGMPAEEAVRLAADVATADQLEPIALPRRFSLPMQEIWLMQMRFASRQKRRVFRTLSHPRFRAAYDFLLLRQAASGEHGQDVQFWQQAREQGGRELEASLESSAGSGGDLPVTAEGAGRAPRRRRRRGSPDGSADPAAAE